MTGWRKSGSAARARHADAGPAPSKDVLHEAALAYLARSAASSAMLARVLERRIATWARRAAPSRDADALAADVAACRETVRSITARFREVGLIDDASFAESRARSLSRAGRSRRAISAHLAAKGVDTETAREAVSDDPGVELRAALALARKRRIGPFSREEVDRAAKQKALAAMARAGFSFGVASVALGMDREQAEERLGELL